MQQLLALALQHAGDGDARPTAHHFGNVVGSDLFAHQSASGRTARLTIQLGLDGLDVVLQSLQLGVADFSHLAVVALTLGTLSLYAQGLHLLLVLLNLVDELALTFPLGTELLLLFAEVGDFLVELGELIPSGRTAGHRNLSPDALALDFELSQTAHDFVQFLRHAVTLHAQLGSSLVHQVNGLVWQEALADVAF